MFPNTSAIIGPIALEEDAANLAGRPAGNQIGLRRGLNHLGVLALNLEPGSSTEP
jgi:hypothetical protein